MMRRWELGALGRDNLVLAEAPVPTPAYGEVLVKVAAVALDFRDGDLIRTGLGQALTFPITLASDASGSVAAVGEGVSRFEVGDRVISLFFPEWVDAAPLGTAKTPNYRSLGGGGYPVVLQEYVILDEGWLTPAPTSLGDSEVSTLPLKNPVIQGIAVGHRRAQEDLVRAADHLGIRPVIDGRYAFDDLPAALDHLDRGAFGKVVIEV